MPEPRSIIYLVQCKLKRELLYIGKTHQETLEDRIDQHETSARKGDNTPFHQALIDYGLRNWEWKMIAQCSIEDEFQKEKELIEKYGAAPVDLLNVTHGQKTKRKKDHINKSIVERIKGNVSHTTDKSELGNLFLRQAGKLKPVVNLRTNKKYHSASSAARNENLPISTLRNCCDSGKMLRDGTRYAYLDIHDKPILNKGHQEEHYIGDRAQSRKVKNLINDKVHKNCYDAAKYYKTSTSTIDGAARGKYLTALGKYVFCFIDENGKDIITERHKKGLAKIKKIDNVKYVAWHVDDLLMDSLFYFKTLDEICAKLNLKGKSHIKGVCDGKRSHVDKWRVAYFDSIAKAPKLTERHKQIPRKVIRRVICLNDKKEFDSGADAGIYYKLNSSQITKCAKGEAKSVYCNNNRLRFAFIDDNGNPILSYLHHEPLTARGKSRIQLLKTGKVYNSLAEFLRETGIPYKTAKRYLKDPSIDLFGFEFIELD